MRLASRLALLGLLLIGSQAAQAANPYAAGLLAEVFPGAGYLYQGQTKTGLLASALILPLAAPYYVTTPTFATKSLKINLYYAARNTFGYTVYDSFQSALTPQDRANQVVAHPHYGFWDLAISPFQASTYNSIYTWIPISYALVVGAALPIAIYGINRNLTWDRVALAIPLILAQSTLIGLGEESEFRGFQYPAFAQLTRSKGMGAILQAASFGVCHTSWGVCGSPYGTGQLMRATNTIDRSREYYSTGSLSDGSNITDLQYFYSAAAAGLVLSVISSIDELGMKRAVTAHALYDAILITSDLLVTGGTGRLYMNFTFPLP